MPTALMFCCAAARDPAAQSTNPPRGRPLSRTLKSARNCSPPGLRFCPQPAHVAVTVTVTVTRSLNALRDIWSPVWRRLGDRAGPGPV